MATRLAREPSARNEAVRLQRDAALQALQRSERLGEVQQHGGSASELRFELLPPFKPAEATCGLQTARGEGERGRGRRQQALPEGKRAEVYSLLRAAFVEGNDDVAKAEVRCCVFGGRNPHNPGRKEDAGSRYETCLSAGLWPGKQLMCASAFRVNGVKANAPHVQILYHATSSRHRRLGLGRLLARCIASAAAEAGHKVASVAVVSEGVQKAFWRQVGFLDAASARASGGASAVCSHRQQQRGGAALLLHHRALEAGRPHCPSNCAVWAMELEGPEGEARRVDEALGTVRAKYLALAPPHAVPPPVAVPPPAAVLLAAVPQPLPPAAPAGGCVAAAAAGAAPAAKAGSASVRRVAGGSPPPAAAAGAAVGLAATGPDGAWHDQAAGVAAAAALTGDKAGREAQQDGSRTPLSSGVRPAPALAGPPPGRAQASAADATTGGGRMPAGPGPDPGPGSPPATPATPTTTLRGPLGPEPGGGAVQPAAVPPMPRGTEVLGASPAAAATCTPQSRRSARPAVPPPPCMAAGAGAVPCAPQPGCSSRKKYLVKPASLQGRWYTRDVPLRPAAATAAVAAAAAPGPAAAAAAPCDAPAPVVGAAAERGLDAAPPASPAERRRRELEMGSLLQWSLARVPYSAQTAAEYIQLLAEMVEGEGPLPLLEAVLRARAETRILAHAQRLHAQLQAEVAAMQAGSGGGGGVSISVSNGCGSCGGDAGPSAPGAGAGGRGGGREERPPAPGGAGAPEASEAVAEGGCGGGGGGSSRPAVTYGDGGGGGGAGPAGGPRRRGSLFAGLRLRQLPGRARAAPWPNGPSAKGPTERTFSRKRPRGGGGGGGAADGLAAGPLPSSQGVARDAAEPGLAEPAKRRRSAPGQEAPAEVRWPQAGSEDRQERPLLPTSRPGSFSAPPSDDKAQQPQQLGSPPAAAAVEGSADALVPGTRSCGGAQRGGGGSAAAEPFNSEAAEAAKRGADAEAAVQAQVSSAVAAGGSAALQPPPPPPPPPQLQALPAVAPWRQPIATDEITAPSDALIGAVPPPLRAPPPPPPPPATAPWRRQAAAADITAPSEALQGAAAPLAHTSGGVRVHSAPCQQALNGDSPASEAGGGEAMDPSCGPVVLIPPGATAEADWAALATELASLTLADWRPPPPSD